MLHTRTRTHIVYWSPRIQCICIVMEYVCLLGLTISATTRRRRLATHQTNARALHARRLSAEYCTRVVVVVLKRHCHLALKAALRGVLYRLTTPDVQLRCLHVKTPAAMRRMKSPRLEAARTRTWILIADANTAGKKRDDDDDRGVSARSRYSEQAA